jgi:hypothetical protein
MENKYFAPGMAVAMYRNSPSRRCQFFLEVRVLALNSWVSARRRAALCGCNWRVPAAEFNNHPRIVFSVPHVASPRSILDVLMI